MHQPKYKDPTTGQYTAPWVRLHAARDYLRMAEIIGDYPEVHATFNFVPVLLEQLADYARGDASDAQLLLSESVCWTSQQKEQLLATFFDVGGHALRCRPRYMQLYQLREEARKEAALFSDDYYRDLVALFNLAWLSSRQVCQGNNGFNWPGERGFSAEDTRRIIDAQTQIIRQVIPAYKALATGGQIEMTTSPYYHPILPLLYDLTVAREVSPGLELPAHPFAGPEDARYQLSMAVEAHRATFGQNPEGLWPSEGGVSEAMLPDVADCGFAWLASDENVLARSLGVEIHRNESGRVLNPEVLYRPYKVESNGRPLALVFRDRFLSDQVGFAYGQWNAQQAVDDLIERLHVIREDLRTEGLVTIVLDGENCWGNYENNGDDFLTQLYQALRDDPCLRTVTVSEYLREQPAEARLPRLAAGSWIPTGFETWVGQPEQNVAWDLLAQARASLLKRSRGPDGPQTEGFEKAWKHLCAAEGSDWFWWCFQANQVEGKSPYQGLFLKHIQAVYG